MPEELKLIVGTKVEYNDFTGFEIEPNARAVWSVSSNQTLWTAVSRATRTPNRADDDLFLVSAVQNDPTTGLPTEIDLVGNRNFGSEDLLATEIGYRIQPMKSFSVDLALFYNHYENLVSYEQGMPQLSLDRGFPVIQVPLSNTNSLRADTFGGEIVADVIPVSGWHLQASYAYLNIASSIDNGKTIASVSDSDRETPQNQFLIRSLIDLPHNFEFDTTLRYIDKVSQYDISSYTEMGVRLGWKASESLEFSILAENLLSPDHREYVVNFINAQAAEVERTILGKVTWKF